MKYWTIYNKFITSRFFAGGMYGLAMIMVTSAIAGNTAVDSGGSHSQYPALLVAEQSNPWVLPQTQESHPGFQQQPYDYYQQYQSAPQDTQKPDAQSRYRQHQPVHQWQPQTDRFVTPEFLESLKQQQQLHQVMPENRQYRQPVPQQFMQMQPGARLPGLGGYSYPSYGAGSANPFYDTPAVSPWGDGSDVLYRGESFPLVPSEALGGFPPMHVPSFGINNYRNSEADGPVDTDENNVFNPFTFLPNGGSR